MELEIVHVKIIAAYDLDFTLAESNMPPRIVSPFICPSCARHLSKSRRHISTVSSQSRSKVHNVDEFLTSPSTTPLSLRVSTKKHNQYPIPSSALSYHWDTSPASPSTLQAANKLFTSTKPTHLWTRSTFRDTPTSSLPEVAFLGRSNVGKSSLLNAMLGAKELARTSSRPGRTKTMNAFLVGGDGIKNSGKGKLVVLDMPGYGKGARAEWGVEVVKYLRARKQLKRAILLLSAHHLTDTSPSKPTSTNINNSPLKIKLKATDKLLLSLLRTHGIPHQVILSKIDRVLFPSSNLPSGPTFSQNVQKLETIMHGLQDVVQPPSERKKKSKSSTVRREGPPALGEIWACAADGRAGVVGVDGVRVAVMRACGLELGRGAAKAWAVDRYDDAHDDDDDDGNEVEVGVGVGGGGDYQEQDSREMGSRH